MSSPVPPKRKRSHRWWRVLVAVILIVGVNIGLYKAWQKYLPQVTLFPISHEENVKQNIAVAPETVIEAAPVLDGQKVASQLLDVFPDVGSLWQRAKSTRTPMGLAVDAVCPLTRGVFPSIQDQHAWRSSNGLTEPSPSPSSSWSTSTAKATSAYTVLDGLVAQVRIYRAGMGPLAMQQLRDQVRGCEGNENWRFVWEGDGSLGAESMTFGVSGDNASQQVVVFREGDILGVVAVKGPADASALAAQWQSRWGGLLKGVCLDTRNTLRDAVRQPFYKGYKGYESQKDYTLDSINMSEVENNVAAEMQANAQASASPDVSAVPAPVMPSPLRESGAELQVFDAPENPLGIDVGKAPSKPKYPDAPGNPPLTSTITGPMVDKNGPGCGWALTNQAVPIYDSAASAAAWQKAQADAEGKAKEIYANWVRKTWKYGADYEKYVAKVTVWNAWVEESKAKIAVGEWTAYDAAIAAYGVAQAQYIVDMDAWRTCIASLPTETPTPIPTLAPTPTPTVVPVPTETITPVPAPTDSGVPIPSPSISASLQGMSLAAVSCPSEPVAPVQPKEPSMPRPDAVPMPIPTP